MTDIESLQAYGGQLAEAAESANASAKKQHEYVNGDSSTDVLTESGLVPSLAKQAVQGQEKVTAVLTEVASQLAGATTYDTTELGLLKTVDGGYFSTPSPAKKGYLISWRNTAGKAVYQDTYPNVTAIEEIGIEDQSSEVSGLAFAVVDDAGRRTWLEAGIDGGPSAHAAEKIGEVLTTENAPALAVGIAAKAIADSIEAVGIEELSELNDLSFATVDEEDNRLWIEAGTDGKPTQYAIDCIVEKLPEGLGEAPSTYQSGVKGVLKISSGPNIRCFGDSMTAGAGGDGTTYPGVLQDLLTNNGYSGKVFNHGVGGEDSVTITARAGGNPFMVLPVHGVIPASTAPFEITLQAIGGIVPRPLIGSPFFYSGRLDGIPGIFSRTVTGTTYTYFFSRAVAGSEVTANRPMPLYLDISDQARGDLLLIWIGQNGPNDVRAIQDAKAIIQRMTALDKRYLVISKPGGTSTSDVDDAKWFAEFGRRFISSRRYMVEYGLADAGITPTDQDVIDMENGMVPSSLRVDSVHWKAIGYTIFAKNMVFKRLKEMEWI